MSTRAAAHAEDALKHGARAASVLGGVEEVRIHPERDVRRGVAELEGHEDDVEPLRNQETRVPVPQIVETQLAELGRLKRLVEPRRASSSPLVARADSVPIGSTGLL